MRPSPIVAPARPSILSVATQCSLRRKTHTVPNPLSHPDGHPVSSVVMCHPGAGAVGAHPVHHVLRLYAAVDALLAGLVQGDAVILTENDSNGSKISV